MSSAKMVFTRQEEFMPAQLFRDKSIHVIGCGSVGSHAAISLVKTGWNKIHLWDFDRVEEHNISNQAYRLADVGRNKAEALADIIKSFWGVEPTVHTSRVDGRCCLSGYIMMFVDNMKSRSEIWYSCAKGIESVKLITDVRIGIDRGQVYLIDPNDRSDISSYEFNLYEDKDAAPSVCRTAITLQPVASMFASYVVYMLNMAIMQKKDGYKNVPSSHYLDLFDCSLLTKMSNEP
jgi:hypothetical protein